MARHWFLKRATGRPRAAREVTAGSMVISPLHTTHGPYNVRRLFHTHYAHYTTPGIPSFPFPTTLLPSTKTAACCNGQFAALRSAPILAPALLRAPCLLAVSVHLCY